VPNLDSTSAVLLTLLGTVITLTGLALLLVSAFVPGMVIVALGLAGGSIGYRAISSR